MTKLTGLLAPILALTLLAGGCSRQPPAGAGEASVSLIPVTFEQWEEERARLRGSLVVVDMWATWCAPCIERFPHMVGLHRKYGKEGVEFVSMCLDDRDDPDALKRAEEFLVGQQATFRNYRMDEIIPDAFEKLDLLGIPAVFIYDRAGDLARRLTGDNPNAQFTDEDVEAAIRQLLAK